jgi:hypothetical protein
MYNRMNAGTGDIGTIKSNNRTAAILYSLGTLFFLGNICINTLHKGDNDDNSNKGTTENSHIGHCTHTSKSANIKVDNSQRRN